MTGRNWWAIDVVSSLVLFGFISSSGIVWLAHRFVNEFTHSHVVLDDEQYTWDMPLAESDPSPTKAGGLFVFAWVLQGCVGVLAVATVSGGDRFHGGWSLCWLGCDITACRPPASDRRKQVLALLLPLAPRYFSSSGPGSGRSQSTAIPSAFRSRLDCTT